MPGVFVKHPDNGKVFRIPDGDLDLAISRGFSPETQEETSARLLQKKYGDSDIRAGLEGAARGATFGLSDVAMRGLGVPAEDLAGRQEANPVAAGIGEVAGVAGSLLIPGGAIAKGAGAAAKGALGSARAATVIPRVTAKAGLAVEKKLLGQGAKSLAAKAAAKAAAGSIEGAAYAAGHAVSEVALGKAELNAETFVSHIGVGALIGGAATGGLGALAGVSAKPAKFLAEKARKKAQSIDLDSWAGKQAVKALNGSKKQHDDLARAVERGQFKAEDLGEELLKPREELAGASILSPTGDKQATLANISTFKESFGARIGKALEELDALGAQGSTPYGVSAKKISARIRKEVLEGMIGKDPSLKSERKTIKGVIEGWDSLADDMVKEWSGKGLLKQGDKVVEMRLPFTRAEQFKRNLQTKINYNKANKTLADDHRQAVARILREEVEDSSEALATHLGRQDLAAQFKDGKRMFGLLSHAEAMAKTGVGRQAANRGLSLTDNMWTLGGVVTGADFGSSVVRGLAFGALNKAARSRGNAVLSHLAHKSTKLHRMAGVVHGANKKMLSAVDDLFASGITKFAPPASVGVYERMSFPAHFAPNKESSPAKQRIAEINELMTHPELLAETLTNRVSVLSDAAPQTATHLINAATRAIQHLHEVAPKRQVDPYTPQADDWEPSTAETARFARRLAVVESPLSVLDSLKSGMLTAEEVETLGAVYPETLEALRSAIIGRMSESKKKIPYLRRVHISTLLGLNIEHSMQPEALQRAQAVYEQGEQDQPQATGGTKSVSMSNLTLGDRSASKFTGGTAL